MLTQLINFLYPIAMVALLFGGTVLVHELGHFLTAKWLGLKITAFSIGMGPALWKKEVNGVVYKISALPIGGYVALPQMDITGSAFESEEAKAGGMEPVHPWKRIVIALAGPVMNVIAAFLLCATVYWVGKPSDPGPGPAVVGWVNPDSASYTAGLREGDRILKANRDSIEFWTDFQIAASLNKELDIQILRGNHVDYLYDLPTEVSPEGFRHLSGVVPVVDISAASLTEGGAAADAGILPGDILLKFNQTRIRSGGQFVELVQANGGTPVELEVLTPGAQAPRTITLTPRRDEKEGRWLVGVYLGYGERIEHPRPLTQMRYFSGTIFRTLKAFARTKERGEAAKSIGGPVMILSGMHAQVSFDFMQAVWFTALINVNLAIINLLPLIILDGGHIMVALYEWILGRPPRRSIITAMANIMVVLLISLMVLLSFRDVLMLDRIYGGGDPEPTPTATVTAPQPSSTDRKSVV